MIKNIETRVLLTPPIRPISTLEISGLAENVPKSTSQHVEQELTNWGHEGRLSGHVNESNYTLFCRLTQEEKDTSTRPLADNLAFYSGIYVLFTFPTQRPLI